MFFFWLFLALRSMLNFIQGSLHKIKKKTHTHLPTHSSLCQAKANMVAKVFDGLKSYNSYFFLSPRGQWQLTFGLKARIELNINYILLDVFFKRTEKTSRTLPLMNKTFTLYGKIQSIFLQDKFNEIVEPVHRQHHGTFD